MEEKKRGREPSPVSWFILAVAVGLIVIGILNGGLGDVLEKAKKICMECIGLG